MKNPLEKTMRVIGGALLLALLLAPVAALAETDRLTVEDPATGAVKFKVTSDGNVTGASFTGAPTDGAAISIQQGPLEPATNTKFSVRDASGVDKVAFTADGMLRVDSGGASPQMILTSGTGNATQAPTFIGRKSRGTLTAPTATQAGDNLFTLSGIGFYGTGGIDGNWHFASTAIFMPARENFTSTAKGADIAFLTTAQGTINRTEKFRVTGEGNIGIGTSTPGQKLEVNGGVRINTAIAKPACDSTTRGTFWFTQQSPSDLVEVCAMVNGTLVWKSL